MVEIRANIGGHSPFPIMSLDGVRLGFPLRGLEIDGFATSLKSSKILTYVPRKDPIEVLQPSENMVSEVIFHIVNLSEFHSSRNSSEDLESSRFSVSHLLFRELDIQIHIRSMATTGEMIKSLRNFGGFGVTHLGRLSPVESDTLALDDVREILSALQYFLSFVRGDWSTPIVPLGFDASGHRSWERWNAPRDGSYSEKSNWFDYFGGDQLEQIFPGFMELWHDDDWRKTLREAIFWYIQSGRSGFDAGIILAQAAIERISYQFAVNHQKLVSLNGFKSTNAADHFRFILGSLGIPQEISPHLKTLVLLQKQYNWVDGPQALTEIRNSLVHPDTKRSYDEDLAIFEAWNLGQWYLEMVILSLCKFSGTYSNRLERSKHIGNVETVPWA